jgi:tRNA(fMet)-specific endonuclease VapC
LRTLLLDTNIVSFFMKGNPLVARYRPRLQGYPLAISFMTVAELYEGAYRAKWGRQRLTQLEATLGRYTVIPSSTELSQRWGEVRFQRRRQPISAEDAWIAATALAYDCPLVTHNPGDFRNIPGLQLITVATR